MKILSYLSLIIVLIGGVLGLSSCQSQPPQYSSDLSFLTTKTNNNQPIIYVTNYPLKYFVERIGGNEIQVKFPIPSDIDPAFWQPEGEIIGQLQQGDLILLNGATYEKWLTTVSLPESKLVDTSKNFQNQYIPIKSSVTHSHGLEGKHSHGGIAFTTWLNLQLAIKQAQTIRDALIEIKPDKAEIFNKNYQALEKDLLTLDQQIESIIKTKPEQKFIASHPVYDYFKQRYGINLVSVHFEPETVPTEIQWTEFDKILKTHPTQWMIWEGEPNPETVAKLKEKGIKSLVFSPVGNQPKTGDFMSIMKQNIENLKLAYSDK